LDKQEETAKKTNISGLLNIKFTFSVNGKRVLSFEIKRKGQNSLPRWLVEAIFKLLTLIIVLIWCGIHFDKILENPFYSIILILGILVIIYGGRFVVKNWVEIEKK